MLTNSSVLGREMRGASVRPLDRRSDVAVAIFLRLALRKELFTLCLLCPPFRDYSFVDGVTAAAVFRFVSLTFFARTANDALTANYFRNNFFSEFAAFDRIEMGQRKRFQFGINRKFIPSN